MFNLSFKTTLEIESRTERAKHKGPRLRPIRQIAILVVAELITALILHWVR